MDSSPEREEGSILSGMENFSTINTVYLPDNLKCNYTGTCPGFIFC